VWERGGKRANLPDCIVNLIPPSVRPWLHLYGDWAEGRLWAAGGLADQPHKYVQAMRLLSSTVAQIRSEEREKP